MVITIERKYLFFNSESRNYVIWYKKFLPVLDVLKDVTLELWRGSFPPKIKKWETLSRQTYSRDWLPYLFSPWRSRFTLELTDLRRNSESLSFFGAHPSTRSLLRPIRGSFVVEGQYTHMVESVGRVSRKAIQVEVDVEWCWHTLGFTLDRSTRTGLVSWHLILLFVDTKFVDSNLQYIVIYWSYNSS